MRTIKILVRTNDGEIEAVKTNDKPMSFSGQGKPPMDETILLEAIWSIIDELDKEVKNA